VQDDLFIELVRSALDSEALALPPDPQLTGNAGEVAVSPNRWIELLSDREAARLQFERLEATDFVSETRLVFFLEAASEVMREQGGDALAGKYFSLTSRFIERHSLRYELRPPFLLHPTLPGMFASLFAELREVTYRDDLLRPLMQDFEEAIRDIRADRTSGRIKTCMQKQFNLVEALAARCPNVTAATLGDMCDQVGTWPHATMREVAKKLYGFASNYPGIRHAGNPASSLREIDTRDLVALAVVLAGLTPYLAHEVDAGRIYSG